MKRTVITHWIFIPREITTQRKFQNWH